ncbi:acyl transferase/acyl hydrolase/lysophospholipase [Dactylonectria estremocensis]|uniref:Acyl transferase/acyl hydrolase/lysophospholipase n=1 Tax=Dactylonectria estremocensis TaxID=1079267 RepID=A0A9P9EGN1_9HYPO|nr:acyl transferase/acyl hydrolase/lysophospholipase [Dactylonectria estremocensis]
MASSSARETRLGGGIRLLCFDGGGVRGLSSLRILQRVVELIDPVNPPKPCDCFDMIAGTSTGGLIAIMLGRLKMSVFECIEEYQKLSTAVFTKTRHRVGWSGNLQGRFDHEALENGIKGLLQRLGLPEDELMKEGDGAPLCKTFVCAMNQQTSKIVLFPNYYSRKWGTCMLDCARIWQVARATSAATSFFEPVSINESVFVDGATGANNPVYELWAEALEVFFQGDEGRRLHNIGCLVSIGTGLSSLKKFGETIPNVLKAMKGIAIDSEEKIQSFLRDFPCVRKNDVFFRFNVVQGLSHVGLEEKDRLADIDAYTDNYCHSPLVMDQMEMCAKLLKEPKFSGTPT